MTPEKVEHAIQVAYHSLKFWSENWDFWRKAGGYLHAELMAMASVQSILPGTDAPIVHMFNPISKADSLIQYSSVRHRPLDGLHDLIRFLLHRSFQVFDLTPNLLILFEFRL